MSLPDYSYYVYAYLREDLSPYSIGKGKGKRLTSKTRCTPAPVEKSRIVIIIGGLTETRAFCLEIDLIRFYGRLDKGTGILRNMTDGGEGASGMIKTEETRRKLSRANSGKTLTVEQKQRISEVQRGKKRSPMPIEVREKISAVTKGRVVSEETREKLRIINIGKRHTEEAKEKISAAHTGRVVSEETRRKLSLANKGMKMPPETVRRVAALRKANRELKKAEELKNSTLVQGKTDEGPFR